MLLSEQDLKDLSEFVNHSIIPGDANVGNEELSCFLSENARLSQTIVQQQVQKIEERVNSLLWTDRGNNRNFGIALDGSICSIRPDIHITEDFQNTVDDNLHFESGKSSPILDHRCSDTVIFSSHGQSRSGSHHGRGGRRKGSGFRVRENYARYTTSVICQRMYALYTRNECNGLHILLEDLIRDQKLTGSLADVSQKFRDRFTGTLQKNIEAYPYTMELLPFCVLGVSARFTTSDTILPDMRTTGGSMSRHVANTWLDCDGGLRCTCLGSTQYSILAQNQEFNSTSCEHTQAFLDIFTSISFDIFGSQCLSAALIFKTLSSVLTDLGNPPTVCFPFFRYMHRNRTVVYVCEVEGKASERCWVPIRCVQRKGMKFLCAFCDSISTNSCQHVQGFSRLRLDPTSNSYAECFEEENVDVEEPPDNNSHTGPDCSKSGPISYLPVAPVNCAMAIKTEFLVCEKIRTKDTFVLEAPSLCIYCQSPPVAGSEKTNSMGMLMCTLGACRMQVKTLYCCNCNKRYSAEGRNDGVFLESLCSGATHALLRNELLGFALGNGTLNSRLNQLHSNLAALEDFKMFPDVIPSLSSKTLFSMCTSFARLAVTEPPEELFWCSTCQDKTNGKATVPSPLCIDGIWAGYLRKSKRAFKNITYTQQETVGKEGITLSGRQSCRPRTSFVRLERTVTYLLHAIKGEKIEVSTTSINAAVAAIRLVSPFALPEDFYRTSVCGRTATEFDFDEGCSVLKKIRDLTSFIFDGGTVIYRLLQPILLFFQGLGKRRKSKKAATTSLDTLLCHSDSQSQVQSSKRKKRKKTMDPESCCSVISKALQLSPLGEDDSDVIPWNPLISEKMKKNDAGKKILSLYRCLLQGPITHLFPKGQLRSARYLAESCIRDDPKEFMKEMVSKEKYNVSSALDTRSNIAEVNRILLAGLFNAAIIDTSLGLRSSHSLLRFFGHVIEEGIWVVERFYEFNDAGLNEANGRTISTGYAKEWNLKDYETLRKKFEEYVPQFLSGSLKDYEDSYVTGTFFPGFPQIRPLLFNDKGKKGSDLDKYGFCSKHYLQQKGSFTPGAVTFCCGCAHPIVLGFKVLEWDEGPRAILDVLVSRFVSFPRYLVYDFACGLYKSAVHSLWWAIEDSTLISDPFHGGNHRCSPSFTKAAHIPLDMSNTISHEQRNRPIAKIKSSLQQTSQDTYISLLAFQIMVNNISAKARTACQFQVPVQKRSATDLEWGYFKQLKLSCRCCSVSSSL